jgi:hypothetical protein
MGRKIGAILAGLLVFAVVALAFWFAAHTGWPAYAEVEKQRAFTLDMQITRLAVGMLATLAAGAAASCLDHGVKQTVLLTGMVLLLISVVDHIYIWDQYPVWYHLVYLAYLVPLTLLGGHLARTMSTS